MDAERIATERGASMLDDLAAISSQRTGNTQAPSAQHDWPEPSPLNPESKPQPYPLDALPPVLRAAIEEVQAFVQAPLPLVVCSALAALSTAAQAYVDVERAPRLHGPTSLFLLMVADSGERKTTLDNFFTKAVRDWEDAQRVKYAPIVQEYEADADAWEAKRTAILENIRTTKKAHKDTGALEAELRAHQANRPQPPRVPRLIYVDATPEALAYGLAKRWPSGAVLSSEAGTVLGSHGMSREAAMRNMAMLNTLWDGGALPIERRTSESIVVKGARLTVGLAVQGATLRAFVDDSRGLARGIGLFARMLLACPESTQGTRAYKEPPEHWPAVARLHRRIESILEVPAPVDEATGALAPAMLTLQPQAKAAWVGFHDAIEAELRADGELRDVRDVASKAADNVARLAALLTVFERPGAVSIDADTLNAAGRIVAWHLDEARRFFGGLAVDPAIVDAGRLEAWLIERMRSSGDDQVATQYVQQFITPKRLRERSTLDAALATLSALGRLRVVTADRRRLIELNPAVVSHAGAQ